MIRCHFCRSTASGVAHAIALDWMPSFFDELTGDEVFSPVCSECCGTNVIWDGEFGEYVSPAVDASGCKRS